MKINFKSILRLISCLIFAFGTIHSAFALEYWETHARLSPDSDAEPQAVISGIKKLLSQATTRTPVTNKSSLNPETGLPECEVDITSFTCKNNSNALSDLTKAFEIDKDTGYRSEYLNENNDDRCAVSTPLGIEILHNKGWNTWVLMKKNFNDPRLRDIYALTTRPNGNMTEGKIYCITTLREEFGKSDRLMPLTEAGISVIEGKVEKEVADACRYVDILEKDELTGEYNAVKRVPVSSDNTFRYEKFLDKPISIRVLAQNHTDQLSLLMFPGFTFKMGVTEDVYLLYNFEEYKSMATRYQQTTSPRNAIINNTRADNTDKDILITKLDAYKAMVNSINAELVRMKNMRDPDNIARATLNTQLVNIYNKMILLIDAYGENTDNPTKK